VDALQATDVFPQATQAITVPPVILNVTLPNGTMTLNDREPQIVLMSNPNRTDATFTYVVP
jgi:hypothetical protein